ncbi:hypothetical protein GCM10022220_05270 [Actinocatenispora rupis]|uniref:Pentapeptide repeat-containing protein n=1 Tax=Actinocatenispora rupis TaxID=519421 RepID=A0A8J3JJ82_9ACTN|nr:hypothetical protein Aru02nite_68820 [Actinocatenispora rupis]
MRLRFGAQLALFVLLGAGVLVGSGWLLLHGLGGALHLGNLGASEQLDIVKIAMSVVAGVGAVIALTVAYRKQQLGEASEARAEATHHREEIKLFTERFGACVAQLGNDSPAVRLGGAYALAHLADDWESGRQTCIDVLCAQLRMPCAADQPDEPDTHAAFLSQREVRHTMWRLIGNHLRPGASRQSWCGHDFDFSGALVDGADLRGAVFSSGSVSFVAATFSDGVVDLRDAVFCGADVMFSGARFCGGIINATDATFSAGNVEFLYTQVISGAIKFDGARFIGAAVQFPFTQLLGGEVDFSQSHITAGSIDFAAVDFRGGTVDFSFASIDGGVATLVSQVFIAAF